VGVTELDTSIFEEMDSPEKIDELIKKLTDKGYGFIVSEELGKDLFFHSKSLVGVTFEELREGDKVSFESEQTQKGLNAINVKKMGSDNSQDMGSNSAMADDSEQMAA